MRARGRRHLADPAGPGHLAPARTRYAEQLRAAAMTTVISTPVLFASSRRVAMLDVSSSASPGASRGTIGELNRRVASRARLLGVLIDRGGGATRCSARPGRHARSRISQRPGRQGGRRCAGPSHRRRAGARSSGCLAETKMTIGAWRQVTAARGAPAGDRCGGRPRRAGSRLLEHERVSRCSRRRSAPPAEVRGRLLATKTRRARRNSP